MYDNIKHIMERYKMSLSEFVETYHLMEKPGNVVQQHLESNILLKQDGMQFCGYTVCWQ